VTKTEAIDAVEVGNAEWIERAEKLALMWLRKTGEGAITSDDIWRVVKHAGIPREPRAMGALMRRLQRSGVIAPMNVWTPSTRRECHSRPVRWWRVVV